jgi:hypothetical protein
MPGGWLLTGNLLRESTLAVLSEPEDAAFGDLAEFWRDLVAPSPARRAAPPDDNWLTVHFAVQCGDSAWPRDVRVYQRAVAHDLRHHPDSGGRHANIGPCAFWPAPVEPPVRIGGLGPRNVLVLQNLRDPATPLAAGLGMRSALGSRGSLVIADSGGHGVLGVNDCASAVALAYLTADRRALPPDRRC